MLIVSGLTTSNGISVLLNMGSAGRSDPGRGSREIAALASDQTKIENRKRIASEAPRLVSVEAKPEQTKLPAKQDGAADSRYAKFLLAVQALRLPNIDIATATPRQAQMVKAAREIFMIDDGVPKPVRPETDPNSFRAVQRLEASITALSAQPDRAQSHGDVAAPRLLELV